MSIAVTHCTECLANSVLKKTKETWIAERDAKKGERNMYGREQESNIR
jgi:hypothetical protein